MKASDWKGVFPAITTPFREGLAVDFDFLGEHVRWLIDKGCAGIVALGSLGESATLTLDEKLAILETCRDAAKGKVPVIAGVAGLSTADCVAFAQGAERAGCSGLMVLPAYVYRGDEHEATAHAGAVIDATRLSCMLYNNPIAYGVDYVPRQIAGLARRHENLHAVKESTGDVRRVTAIREVCGDRLAVFVGVDDVIVEGIAAGAVGWIAGLVNAFPAESVLLFDLAIRGESEGVRRLYEWFLPLLRLDTVPKFVQLIKLVQQEIGRGSERVRPPRLPLSGEEREAAFEVIRSAIRSRTVL
ncbi:MAG TPA: dihydrodipicolinate synthase family protein [Thermoanaerobaculia bacterium]|nr:dihydrodipicolinate synthase family protein [Thermoanaerobaculia bacterium]